MKQMPINRFLLTICFMALVGSVALAEESDLTLPNQVDGSITLRLEGDLAGINPANQVAVFVGTTAECCAGRSPIAGRYSVEGQDIVFDPAFELISGQDYTVRSGDTSLTAFRIENAEGATSPEVIAIYPSGPDVPENTLRFYIEFSVPMQPHVAMDFIALVDADGAPDEAAFMSFKQELWNHDRTRLTLLMDPGRIKRGVATNIALGPALIAGNSYAIRIAEGWQGAGGTGQAPAFEHTFVVSNALRSRPDTDAWHFQDPRNATRDPLLITFDRPFDAQMGLSAITVLNSAEQPVAGEVTVLNGERAWQFVPQDVWATETLHVVVDANFEDVAGNNFNEVLDHAVGTQPLGIDRQTVARVLGAAPD